ncbi:MAG: peptidylprolyl isomerase [SAR86 cluster bacterium]|uniref:Peptidyl-prolyl cis-trans isomerase n=1 Tax=SAR86 cluster bacterium TaxID=2030880 RepID=A0A2A5BBH4_9GAMM|nr:MAG: peptidylprolyl isomerase [SAR86 cluster bacterium]
MFVVSSVFISSSGFAQQLTAIIDTSKGEISVELNARAAPTTVANFVNLAMRGFYDGLIFHRVERNFMVQGGDPLGNGTGGPGYKFRGEIVLHHNQPGIISMANSGPGTDGSQFFLTHLATPHLNGLHSVFGKVVSGLPVVNQLRRKDIINSIVITGDPASLFKRKSTQLDEWNGVLDAEFPDLKPALVMVEN